MLFTWNSDLTESPVFSLATLMGVRLWEKWGMLVWYARRAPVSHLRVPWIPPQAETLTARTIHWRPTSSSWGPSKPGSPFQTLKFLAPWSCHPVSLFWWRIPLVRVSGVYFPILEHSSHLLCELWALYAAYVEPQCWWGDPQRAWLWSHQQQGSNPQHHSRAVWLSGLSFHICYMEFATAASRAVWEDWQRCVHVM